MPEQSGSHYSSLRIFTSVYPDDSEMLDDLYGEELSTEIMSISDNLDRDIAMAAAEVIKSYRERICALPAGVTLKIDIGNDEACITFYPKDNLQTISKDTMLNWPYMLKNRGEIAERNPDHYK